MSHFSVLVAIPGANLRESATSLVSNCLDDIMAPYCENTDNPAYLSFEDIEDTSREEYITDLCYAVRFPDGSIKPAYSPAVRDCFHIVDDALVLNPEHSLDHTDEELAEMLAHSELIPDYPCNKLYPTFKEYMEDYRGLSNKNLHHRYGYYSNPQTEWDWYQIGGRWPGTFLVKDSTTDFISSEDSGEDDTIDGFHFCSGARKKDICWDKMTQIAQDELREKHRKYCDIVSGIRGKEGFMCIEDGCLMGWGSYPLLQAGETEAEFLERNRAGKGKFGFPPFYAFVDTEGDWHGQGDMGWWGISSNDKDESAWNRECREFIENCADSTVLVMVDCHI